MASLKQARTSLRGMTLPLIDVTSIKRILLFCTAKETAVRESLGEWLMNQVAVSIESLHVDLVDQIRLDTLTRQHDAVVLVTLLSSLINDYCRVDDDEPTSDKTKAY